jgi:hypothetical protein
MHSMGSLKSTRLSLKDPDTWSFFDRLSFSWMNK